MENKENGLIMLSLFGKNSKGDFSFQFLKSHGEGYLLMQNVRTTRIV